MAAATVAGNNTGGGTTNGATVPLPASIANGDKLLILLGVNAGSAFSTPSGWTKIVDYDFAPAATNNHMVVYVRDADGTEGSSVSVTWTGGSVKWASITYRITGADAVANWAVSTETTAAATSIDAASFSPGSTKDWLWILFENSTNTYTTTTTPTGYTNLQTATSAGSGSANSKQTVSSAEKATTGTSSEDPPSWNFNPPIGVSVGAWTLAVAPAATGAYTDSATASVDIQASGTETLDALDSSTVPMALSVSATELREVTDSATVLIDIQTSGTEFPAKEYTDAAIPSVKLTPSGTELREVTDTATVPVTLTPSGTELRETTEAATVLIDIQASGTDVYGQIGATAPFIRQPMIVGGIAIQDRSRW